MAAFDWYQATVRVEPREVVGGLREAFRAGPPVYRKPVHGYDFNAWLQGEGGEEFAVWYGSRHPWPHVVCTGESAQPGAQWLRTVYPEQHLPSRADSRVDFDQAGAFDRVLPHMLAVASSKRIKVDTRGDHLLTKQGRTVYLGASKSACRHRLYDKAAELRAKFAADPVRLAQVPEHLTRYEVQVRPETLLARQWLAQAEPLAVMGASPWLRDLWKRVAGEDLEPVSVGKPWRQSDDDRAYAYMLAHYGGLIERRILEQGAVGFGKQLEHDLAERAMARRAGASRQQA